MQLSALPARLKRFASVCLFLACLLPICQLTSSPARAEWREGFTLEYDQAGLVDDRIRAMTIFEGDLVVAGNFTSAGGTDCHRVARWDGSSWQPLGSEAPGWPAALAIYDGQLWAGGYRWNGAEWEDVLQIADGIVDALIMHDGRLYAGGYFTHARGEEVNHLLSWDGQNIQDCGGGLDGPVMALASDGASLFVGGQFALAGATTEAHNIARWDGSTWHVLGPGLTGDQEGYGTVSGQTFTVTAKVYALAIQGTSLFAGGSFVTAGADTVWNIARWDGAAWHGLGEGITIGTEYYDMGMDWIEYPPKVTALLVAGDELHVGGAFRNAGGPSGNYFVTWDGAGWRPCGESVANASLYIAYIDALLPWDGGLLVGGYFSNEEHGLQHLAMWRDEVWQGLRSAEGFGVDGMVRAQLVLGDSLIAAGSFNRAGGTMAAGIASFDGTRWRSLGAGLTSPPQNPREGLALAGFEGDVVVGGSFQQAGGQPALNVARWTGSEWQAMGSGITEHGVRSLGVFQGSLYAGSQTEDPAPAHLYRWDGTDWQEVLEVTGESIATLLPMGDDLLLGGNFTAAGGSEASCLALFDGVSARPFSSDVFGEYHEVLAADIYEGDLVVGGSFLRINGVWRRFLARWDGAAWTDMGTPFTHLLLGIQDILVRDAQLFVGGWIEGPGTLDNTGVAMYRDGGWHSFEGGCSLAVYSLALYKGDLYTGGWLVLAGSQPVHNFACWTDEALPVYLLGLTATRDGRGVRITWELGGGADGATVQLWRATGAPGGADGQPLDPGDVPPAGMRVPVGEPVAASAGSHSVLDPAAPGEAAAYWLEQRLSDGTSTWLGSARLAPATPVARVAILDAWPNPFNPSLTIRFAIPQPGPVTVTAHDLRGRRVAVLHEGPLAAGEHTLLWDGRSAGGKPLSAGRYLVRVEHAGGRDVRGVTVVR